MNRPNRRRSRALTLTLGALLAALSLLGPGTAPKADATAPATVTMPSGKVYRAFQVPTGGFQVETSLNGGATWAYGFYLGAPTVPQGAIVAMFAVGNTANVVIRNSNTGHDYVKSWNSSWCDGDCVGASPWTPYYDYVNDRP